MSFYGIRLEDVPLWTWETRTAFGSELDESSLKEILLRDLGMEQATGTPVFRKMVSFNGSEGRLHRYLVSFPKDYSDANAPRFSRILPFAVIIYSLADEFIKSVDCNGNLRYGALWRGTLYVLVFFEGRLCHWCEESGYGENSEEIETRLERFDRFLRQDELFSRTESWCLKFERLPDELDTMSLSRNAKKDPFWKTFDLNCNGKKSRKDLFFLLVVLLVSLLSVLLYGIYGMCETLESQVFLDSLELPELSLPPPEIPSAEKRERAVYINSFAEKKVEERDEGMLCVNPEIVLRGIVSGRIFQGVLSDGSSRYFRVGDSLGSFTVSSIGRDRVLLSCGLLEKELFNGTR